MSLLQTIIGAVGTAFASLGDLPKTGIIRSGYIGSYDPATDTTAASWGSERSITLIKWDELAKGEPNTPTSVRHSLIFQAAEVDMPPTEQSQVEVGGELWKVESVEQDSAGATFVLVVYK